MSFDTLSAVQIAIYVPIVFFALRICSKYGVRERGWLLLLVFSLIRIVGCVLLVVAAESPLRYFQQTGDILNASGLSFLLLSTLGLIEIISRTEGPSGERKHWLPFVFRVLHFVGIVALVLTIIGMSNLGKALSVTMEQVGVSLLAGLFIVLVAVTVLQWASHYRLMKYRKQLLVAVSVALPFLAVRTLYRVLYYFPLINATEWKEISGFMMEVFMCVVMEYAVVVIYALAGTVLRLDEDYVLQESD